MNLSQLRIGNIVQDREKNLLSITAIQYNSEDGTTLQVYARKYNTKQEPVLYEDINVWAVRVSQNFVQKIFDRQPKLILHKNPELYLFYDFAKNNFRLYAADEPTTVTIDYLHELQNIYFILTGKEYVRL